MPIDATVMREARSWLSSYFGGRDVSAFDDTSVHSAIDQLYPGGWSHLASTVRAESSVPVSDRDLTPMQAWVKVRRLVGSHLTSAESVFRIRPYDKLLSVDVTPDRIVAVRQVHKLREHSRRDVIAESGLRRDIFTLTEGRWHHTVESVWTREGSQVVTQGRVATPEYVESQAEQVETCYRPGTHKTPMQGWVARAELSWAQAHADDMPEVPSKED